MTTARSGVHPGQQHARGSRARRRSRDRRAVLEPDHLAAEPRLRRPARDPDALRPSRQDPRSGDRRVLAAQGPTDAASGLAGAGDVAGDSAPRVGPRAAGATQIMAAQLYQRPGPFGPVGRPQYQRPFLSRGSAGRRQTSRGGRSPIRSRSTASPDRPDPRRPRRRAVGARRRPALLVRDRHQSGRADRADAARDRFRRHRRPNRRRSGLRQDARLIGRRMSTFLTYSDPPPPGEPAADASGVASAMVSWGDATVSQLHARMAPELPHVHAPGHLHDHGGRHRQGRERRPRRCSPSRSNPSRSRNRSPTEAAIIGGGRDARGARDPVSALAVALVRCRRSPARRDPPTPRRPPTPGALYRDGQTGRYLLGGEWLYRADPPDVGVAQRGGASPGRRAGRR